MVSTKVLATLFSTLLVVSGKPITSRSEYAVKESHPLPQKWKRTSGLVPRDQKLELTIGLKQGNFAELERQLYEVSDPQHARYGQHLTAEQVNELVQPSSDTVELVHSWLREHGIESEHCRYSPAKDWITVTLPLEKVERLIDSKYAIFEHEDGTQAVRTTEWSLPQYLHEHISTIQPTNSFFQLANKPQRKRSVKVEDVEEVDSSIEARGAVPKSCNAKYVDSGAFKHMTTLKCVREFYGMNKYVPKAPAGTNRMAAVNYVEEDTIRSDIEDFLGYYRKDIPAAQVARDFEITLVNGAVDDQDCDGTFCNGFGQNQKADTSAEWMMGIAYPTNFTAYKVEGVPPFKPDYYYDSNVNEDFLTWTNYMLAQNTVPQTIASGWSDEEQTVPLSYAKAVCNQFAQLGARGASVLVESGNFGVGPGGYCLDSANNKPKFLPRFPASCPYVTTIGATTGFNPEKVAYDTEDLFGDQLFSSGAGFSDYFTQPAWQTTAVEAYKKNSLTGNKQVEGYYNKAGRAYPDFAMPGQSIATSWDGAKIRVVDGTDASAAMAAGTFALLNDARIAAGKSPLGFLNPFIYSIGSAGFNDVVVGNTMGCGRKGFPAAASWDAASGWGTPKFSALLEGALNYTPKKSGN